MKYEPHGYYIDCDTAVHQECYDLDEWPGFEDWDEPLAIGYFDTIGSPTHCQVCGLLIDADLEPTGYAYVVELLADYLTTRQGDPKVLTQWVDRYAINLDANDLIELGRAGLDRINADANLPVSERGEFQGS